MGAEGLCWREESKIICQDLLSPLGMGVESAERPQLGMRLGSWVREDEGERRRHEDCLSVLLAYLLL